MLPCIQSTFQRRWKHTGSSLESTLSEWIKSKPKTHYSLDVVSRTQLKALFNLLPTRGREGSPPLPNLAMRPPVVGQNIPIGHHLGILPDKYANSLLRPDGTSPWHAPPSVFTRRQCSGGSFIVSHKSPPAVGMKFLMKAIYLEPGTEPKRLERTNQDAQEIEIRQRLILSQWYPSKTDLLIEERLTTYWSKPYNPARVNKSSLITPKTGILSFAFIPRDIMLYAFATLSGDTHRIHLDLEYAKSEGYPGLVVQVPLQLIVILDTLTAQMSGGGMSFQALEYRVVNPLFSGRRINVYRQWIHAFDKDDDSPVTLVDLEARATPPWFQFGPADSSIDSEVVPPSVRLRQQGRRAKKKRIALFWTATDNGTLGVIALVILVPRHGKSAWTFDAAGGYLVRSEEPKKSDQETQEPDSFSEDHWTRDHFRAFNEPIDFDSSGRPVAEPDASAQVPSTDSSMPPSYPWSLPDTNVDSLESERLERKKNADALVNSRRLLQQYWDKDDDEIND